MMLMNDEALRKNGCDGAASSRAKIIIDLPATCVLSDSALIDRVIAQIFDQLEQTVVELRVAMAISPQP